MKANDETSVGNRATGTFTKAKVLLAAFAMCCPVVSWADANEWASTEEVLSVLEARRDGTLTIIHYSSSLPFCGYCIRNNEHFASAVESLEGQVDFYRVAIDPWQSLRDEQALLAFHEDKGMRLLGVPVVVVYRDGNVLGHIYGEQEDLTDQIRAKLNDL